MSGGFRYSHRDVRKLDIRHIYCGPSHAALRLPPPVDHEGLRHLERIHDQMRQPDTPKLPGKYFEYNKEYRIILPSAPAFRRFSKAEVKDIVRRLNSLRNLEEVQITTTNRDAKAVKSACVARHYRTQHEESPNVKSRAQSAKTNVTNISNRLYSAQTHSATLRQRQKVDMTSYNTSTTGQEKCHKIENAQLNAKADETVPKSS
ncbi:hypothetical protein ACF0H5_021511 [Mactra antiquata]